MKLKRKKRRIFPLAEMESKNHKIGSSSVLYTMVVGFVRFSLLVSKVINLTTNFVPRNKAEIHAINAEKMMSLIMKK